MKVKIWVKSWSLKAPPHLKKLPWSFKSVSQKSEKSHLERKKVGRSWKNHLDLGKKLAFEIKKYLPIKKSSPWPKAAQSFLFILIITIGYNYKDYEFYPTFIKKSIKPTLFKLPSHLLTKIKDLDFWHFKWHTPLYTITKTRA